MERINTIFFNLKFLLIFCCLLIPTFILSQELSNEDIKKLSAQINVEFKNYEDPRTGIRGAGVTSLGRKLIYQYDVPDNWYPTEDMKEVLINNLFEASTNFINIIFKNKIDIGYYYYKNDKIVKVLNIDWEELNRNSFSLDKSDLIALEAATS